MRILVVEDDKKIAPFVVNYLCAFAPLRLCVKIFAHVC
jgi:DNA-binding response OmpR family regulator